MTRRDFLGTSAAMTAGGFAVVQPKAGPTKFQVACMTLPYSAFPLERALSGIRQAGYEFVAWGVRHRDASGVIRPVLAVEAPSGEAAQLAQRCHGMGLEPVMMFSTVHLEAPEALDVRQLGHRRCPSVAAATPGSASGSSAPAGIPGIAGSRSAQGMSIVPPEPERVPHTVEVSVTLHLSLGDVCLDPHDPGAEYEEWLRDVLIPDIKRAVRAAIQPGEIVDWEAERTGLYPEES